MHPTLRGLRRPPEPLIPSCWPRPPGTSRKGSSYARPHPDQNLVPFRSLSAHDPWPRASNDPTSSGAAPLATCPVRVSEKRRQAWGTGREPAGGISSCQEACGPRRGESPGPGPPLQTRTSYLVRARLPSSDVGREHLAGGTVRERAGLLTWSPDPKGTSQPPVADPRDFPAADRPALPAARRPLPAPHATTRRLGHTLNAPTKAPGGASAGSRRPRRARGPLT